MSEPTKDDIRRWREGLPLASCGQEVSREWFDHLCQAIIFQEGTDMAKGIIQPKAKAMLREAGVTVKEG